MEQSVQCVRLELILYKLVFICVIFLRLLQFIIIYRYKIKHTIKGKNIQDVKDLMRQSMEQVIGNIDYFNKPSQNLFSDRVENEKII